jgi:hypothetical protein
MASSASLFCYRPKEPPAITGRDLAGFVEQFARLGIHKPESEEIKYQVKFGRAIDQNDKPTFWEKLVHRGKASAEVFEMHEIKWDIEEQFSALDDMASSLAKHNKKIYRAYLSLGWPIANVTDDLKRVNSPENTNDFIPDQWGMEIGPVETASFSEPEETVGSSVQVGWISVSISGNGYLFPWSFTELVQRAERNPGMRKLMQLCKSTWPVPPAKVEARVVKLRKQLGKLWPYAQHDLPWDWYWGLHEG